MAKHKLFTYICICIVIILSVITQGAWTQNVEFNTSNVADYFRDIKDNVLGHKFIQDLFANAQFSSKYIMQDNNTGHQIAAEMAGKLSQRFTDRIKVVINNRDALVKAFESASQVTSSNECCNLNRHSLEYEPLFLQDVNWKSMCTRVSRDTSYEYTNPVSDEVMNVLKQNSYGVHDLKWQYFGSEEGVLFTFPSHPVSSCESYDPRFRPWYATTATPIIKDVVIVIDTSGSMQGTRINLARQAAITVLDTLNPYDRVNVVRFSTSASTPTGSFTTSFCYKSEFAYALPDNIDYLKTFIQSFQASGSTNYNLALNAAFDIFIKSPEPRDGRERTKVLLFLTDGEPRDAAESILVNIAEKNGKLNNSVTIMTYGLSISLGSDAVKLLQNMAEQVLSDSRKGEINVGVYTAVDSIDKLRFKMGSYYSYFGQNDLNTPIISYPYIDASGLGLITSICLPVYYPPRVLKGVTCVDVRMADIVGDIQNFPGQYSYAFLIDGTGKAFIHPLLPGPLNKESIFLDVAELEREREAKEVIESMKKGQSGHKSFVTTITSARGNVTKQGVIKQKMLATYFWKPVERTNFSVCLVFTERDKQIVLEAPGNVQDFLSYRFDLKMPENACQFQSNVATLDMSSVKYTGAAYVDPSYYLNANIGADELQKLENFLKSDNYPGSSGLKKGVKEMTIVTEKIDAFWKTSQVSFVSSRYIGTYNGVFRSFPGKALPHSFDHKNRPWYDEARSNEGSLVATIPYEDAFTGDVILSLVHTITAGSSSGSSREHVVTGVVGVDISLEYLRYTIEDLLPSCKENRYTCFLAEQTGFLIYHPEFYRTKQAIPNTHITELEPDIARHLIRGERGFHSMNRQYCINLGRKYLHYTWTLALQDARIDKWETHRFLIEKVEGTNLFLGIKENKSAVGSCRCLKSGWSNYIEKCGDDDLNACECPCYFPAKYDYCNNEIQDLENMPICLADKPPTNSTGPIRNEKEKAHSLPKCYSVQCNLKSRRECAFEETCYWCDNNCTEVTCAKPNDADMNGAKPNDADMNGLHPGIIAAIIIAVIILIIVVVIVICRRKKKHVSGGSSRAESAPVGPTHAAVDQQADPRDSRWPSAPPMEAPPPYSTSMHNPAYNPDPDHYNWSQPHALDLKY